MNAALVLLAQLSLSILTISGSPIKSHCSPYFWTTVGKHDAPPCWSDGTSDIVQQLQQVKGYYSSLSELILAGKLDSELLINSQMREVVGEVWQVLNAEENAEEKVTVVCTACKAVIELLQTYQKEGMGLEEMRQIAVNLCTNFKIQSLSVCEGAVHMWGNEILYLLSHAEAPPSEICSFLVEAECGPLEGPGYDWEVELPDTPKPPVLPPQKPSEDAPKLKVLHISDLHFDPYYKEGARVYCGEPLCCRESNGMAEGDEEAAGKFGDWNCDTPLVTLDSMLSHIAEHHQDLSYVIWTGDLPPHDIWNQTKADNLDVVNITVSKISQALPGVPVFPAVGNHEASPANNYPPPSIQDAEWSMDWLYDQLSAEWSRWLPTDTASTIEAFASYTTLVKPGLRVVSLNMNYCYSQNWWLILDSVDPAEELKWLVQILQKAEDDGEKVQILGHIPPGQGDCIKPWSDNYYRIINRYEATVAGQFFGHSHTDGLNLFYDEEDNSRPISVAYVAPSLTTYTGLNPGYRVYELDAVDEGFSGLVTDHWTWVLNLTKSNEEGEAFWYESYSAREEYGLDSLLPEAWDDFYLKMAEEEDNVLLKLFHQHHHKDSPERKKCSSFCKHGYLCNIKSCRKYGDPYPDLTTTAAPNTTTTEEPTTPLPSTHGGAQQKMHSTKNHFFKVNRY